MTLPDFTDAAELGVTIAGAPFPRRLYHVVDEPLRFRRVKVRRRSAAARPGERDHMSKRVSIVIINYNYARFLPRSIQSALDQPREHVEVLVVDDRSTDNSREIIGSYSSVIQVLPESNCGHGASMNAGFRRSTGDLVLFLDSDDYLYPHAVESLLHNSAPNVAQYQFKLDLVDEEGNVLGPYPMLTRLEDGDVTDAVLRSGRYGTTVTSGLAFSREALGAMLPLDESAFRMGGDGFLATVAPLYGRVKTVPGVLGAYCKHGGNHSQFATEQPVAQIAERARWRLHHDAMRYEALRQHAARLGFEVRLDIWRNDGLHLEERIASLLLDPRRHPYTGDRRAALAADGLVAVATAPITARRRRITQAWWLLVGYAPEPLAKRALCWKMEASTRPALLRSVGSALSRRPA
jgi:glycosyltransferase involved in cell wall biosynthesis